MLLKEDRKRASSKLKYTVFKFLLEHFRNVERNMGMDLNEFKPNSIISENLYAEADKLPERPEPMDNPQYGLEDDDGETQEVIYAFID